MEFISERQFLTTHSESVNAFLNYRRKTGTKKVNTIGVFTFFYNVEIRLFLEVLLAYIKGFILNKWLNLCLYISIKNSILMIIAITFLTKLESILKYYPSTLILVLGITGTRFNFTKPITFIRFL
jgi:hypothetical protein